MVTALRGATTCANTKDSILSATTDLLREIINKNGIAKTDIISVFFTATQDLTAEYPAVAARMIGITAALMCQQEMYVEGNLQNCIRALIHVNGEISEPRHVYLGEAVVLRPDLFGFCAIAIDGPSGAGKSTVAKILAEELQYIYVDTGAMYRAVALYGLQNGIDINDENAVTAYLPNISIKIEHNKYGQKIILNDEDVTKLVRTQEVADGSSKIAVYDAVRKAMVSLQRNIAARNNVVMDGRDIGSVVLPNARLKVYLDASVSIRAKRRAGELKRKGLETALSVIEKEIALRDKRDSEREHSPLRRLPEAVYIDTSEMTARQAAEKIKSFFDDL